MGKRRKTEETKTTKGSRDSTFKISVVKPYIISYLSTPQPQKDDFQLGGVWVAGLGWCVWRVWWNSITFDNSERCCAVGR